MQRVGYRYIYERLASSAKFTGYRATPAQSVRAMPWEDAISELSIENAIAQ